MPDSLISDGGPQYTSNDFAKFSQSWSFKHDITSPGNSKANGAAEAAVKVAKKMMRRCQLNHEDPYLGLLNLRNTPTEGWQSSPNLVNLDLIDLPLHNPPPAVTDTNRYAVLGSSSMEEGESSSSVIK